MMCPICIKGESAIKRCRRWWRWDACTERAKHVHHICSACDTEWVTLDSPAPAWLFTTLAYIVRHGKYPHEKAPHVVNGRSVRVA